MTRRDAVEGAVKFTLQMAFTALLREPLDVVETANQFMALIEYIIELEEALQEAGIELPE